MSADDLWAMVKWITAAWLGLLSWIGITQINRINALEKDKADADITSQTFSATFKRIDEGQRENRDVHREIAATLIVVKDEIAETNRQLGSLVGELRGNGTLKGGA